MFEFICDRVVPGCSHRDRADTEGGVRARALEHLRKHHGEFLDDDARAKALTVAMIAAPR